MAFSISSATILLSAAAFMSLFATLASADNHLLPGERLNPGGYLKEGRYTFIMQEDCNLVLYRLDTPTWASGTYHAGNGCYLTLQSDGNLVMYDGNNNRALWASNTGGENGNYVLIVQKDGNVVIYSNPLWATGTNEIGTAGVVVTTMRNPKALTGAEQNKVWEMKKKIAEVTANL